MKKAEQTQAFLENAQQLRLETFIIYLAVMVMKAAQKMGYLVKCMIV